MEGERRESEWVEGGKERGVGGGRKSVCGEKEHVHVGFKLQSMHYRSTGETAFPRNAWI